MATTYISPTGSGDKSGSSWANAAAIGSLDAMARKAGADGTVLLAADKGDYIVKAPIGITGSGVTIKGINTDGSAGEAHFTGTHPAEWTTGAASGNELFRIGKGANNLTFENLQIDNTGTAFRVVGDVSNLKIQHVDADNVQRFLEDYASGANKTATISGLTMRDIDVAGFAENVVRLKYDSHDVLIENVRGDSERQQSDGFTSGVSLTDTVHDVVLRRVTMENATGDRGVGHYWNGDGFSSERGTYNLTFEDTVARGNTDGGYDLKSDHVTLVRALAEDNSRNFRFWGKDVTITDSVGLNPHIRGGSGSQAQLWVDSTGDVTVINSTFADAGSNTSVFENEGKTTLIGVAVAQAATGRTYFGNKPVGLVIADLDKVEAVGSYSQSGTYTPYVKAGPPPEVVAVPPSNTGTTTGAPVGTGAWTMIAGTTASETFTATSLAEMFVIDQSRATGADVIKGFGANDLVVFKTKLGDANNDGVTTFGGNGTLDFSAGNSVKIDGLHGGLRLVGQTADGYVYGDAGLWKAGSALPVAAAETVHRSTAANETYLATNARETFYFDVQSGKTGTDTIRGFGKTDAIVTKVALTDGNKDGLIAPGKAGLDLGGGNLIKELALGKSGLRAMGSTDEGFVYADAAVRPKGAIEGKLTVADTLTGGKTDSATDTFFFDTALHRSLGADKIVNFGVKDVIVTTSQIGTGAAIGSHVDAVWGSFALADEGVSVGSLTVTGIGGAPVAALEYDGVKMVDGVHYYVYSAVDSAVGLEVIG